MRKRTLAWVLFWMLVAAIDIYRNGPDTALAWPVVLIAFGVVLWLRRRFATRLSQPAYGVLVAAVRALPVNRPLVDHETGDVFLIVNKRYLGLPDGWYVLRFSHAPSGEDAMSDFNLGQQVSTVPCTTFTLRDGYVSAEDDALAVKPPQEPGQPPEALDRPRQSRWQALQTLIFVIRTGANRASEHEISTLIMQLNRAAPVGHHGDTT